MNRQESIIGAVLGAVYMAIVGLLGGLGFNGFIGVFVWGICGLSVGAGVVPWIIDSDLKEKTGAILGAICLLPLLGNAIGPDGAMLGAAMGLVVGKSAAERSLHYTTKAIAGSLVGAVALPTILIVVFNNHNITIIIAFLVLGVFYGAQFATGARAATVGAIIGALLGIIFATTKEIMLGVFIGSVVGAELARGFRKQDD